jgi:hypothetical protein
MVEPAHGQGATGCTDGRCRLDVEAQEVIPPQPVILTLSAAEEGSEQSKDPDALDAPQPLTRFVLSRPQRNNPYFLGK